MTAAVDVLILGGGQAGLATGYFLRRTSLSFVILDGEAAPGGAWRHAWDSLRLFSPAEWSSLPGWPMPASSSGVYPSRDEVLAYMSAYEARYSLPVERPVEIRAVRHGLDGYEVETDRGKRTARAVVAASGTWRAPFIPIYPGVSAFEGRQLHSAQYRDPAPFAGQRVLVVGGGNSGAQIFAEVSEVAQTVWVTPNAPVFLPDEVDGRVLFQRATDRWRASLEGRSIETPVGGLGDIVMTPPVRAARDRGALTSVRPFVSFTRKGVVWADGSETRVDVVIWCTGFRPATDILKPLGIVDDQGRVEVRGTQAAEAERLWLVGYGEWTGAASATLIGVMRAARATAAEVAAVLGAPSH